MTSSRWGGMRERYAPGPWATMLRERLGERAAALRDAVNHATGIYFPNRAHRTRVAVKKLRYAVEIAQATGMWRPRHVLQDLKRAQATLGRLHDLQVLTDGLSRLVDEDSVRKDASVLSSAMKGIAEAEFATYLGDRDRLLAICDVSERFASSGLSGTRVRSRPLAAASVLALPAGLLLLSARTARRSPALAAASPNNAVLPADVLSQDRGGDVIRSRARR